MKDSTFPLIRRISFSKMFRLGSPANYEPAKSDSIEAIAEREGRTAPEVAYDILLAPGKKADVNIIDWDKVGFSDPCVTYDLPANGKRLMQKSTGYDATIVSGKVTYRGGEATGELPGTVVRGQR